MAKVTLKDVAKEAGVSAMSVSKALNNKPGVSDETRQRILEVAQKMQYTQNLVARSLRVDETKTIGVVLSDCSELVANKVLRGIQDVASKQGYSVILSNTDHNAEAERVAAQTLISKRIDGLILVAPQLFSNEDIAWLQGFGVPFVLLMRQNGQATIDTIINDNYLGGYQTMEHLIGVGCKSFAFLLLRNSIISQERLNGYRQAMHDYKIDEKNCLFAEVKPFYEEGFSAVNTMLDEIRKCDAVVCACDAVAIGAMSALLDAGIRIPQDISITGYDGVDFCKYLRVPLTTVAQPLYEIGYQGTEVLLDRIKYPQSPVRKLVLKSELIVRESSSKTK